jgi:agmatine/peptidylarginine deiminase
MANQDTLLRNVSDASDSALRKIGACCFTTDPRNLLMWSHYSNHHKGIVFQFEVAKDTTTFLKTVRLNYVKNYPIINWANDTLEELKSTFLNKYDAWSYEKEWRIIHTHGANTLLNFKLEALTGIIFGCNADNNIKNKIMQLLEERKELGMHPVKIFNAYMHDSKYHLVIKT